MGPGFYTSLAEILTHASSKRSSQWPLLPEGKELPRLTFLSFDKIISFHALNFFYLYSSETFSLTYSASVQTELFIE